MSYLLTVPFTSSTLSLPLKGGLSVGLLGVSSVTAGISTWQNQNVSIDDEVKQVFNDTIPTFLKENLWDGGKSIFDSYGSWKDALQDGIISTENPLLKTMGEWGKTIKGGVASVGSSTASSSSSDAVLKIAEEINYYIFKLGEISKQSIEFLPTVIIDTITETALGKELEAVTLGYNKIKKIAEDSGFKDFGAALQGVADTFKEEIEGLTRKQANAIFQIFREAETNNINKFLNDIKNNAEKVKKETDNYKGKLEKILKHVFIGEEKLKKLQETIKTLTNSVEKIKGKIENITDAMITMFKDQLQRLENSMSAE